ncbi:MAG: YraN family protein, partial [Planctomycetales bacterium]|nr:YraN family protein [Planctomycetales bacterium]
DIVALDGTCIVFVEVKTWTSDAQADPSEAVDLPKQRKLTRAALQFLKQRNLLESPARFDVISIVWPDRRRSPSIRHFENAFDATGHGQMFS